MAGKQFWLGPSRAGLTVTFWADQDIIHLLIAGARIKTVRSHLSPVDLATLHARGGRTAGPSPLPTGDDAAFELERVVNAAGIISLGGHQILAAEILAGRPVGIRIDTATLAFFDPDTRTLLRVRPNPLDLERVRRLRGIRPAGPPPRPQAEPVSVQRTIGTGGTICVCRQHVFLGRIYTGRTVTVHVAENTLAVELDGQVRSFQRTTTLPVRNLKAFRARGLPHVS